jgi:hypothetical protein
MKTKLNHLLAIAALGLFSVAAYAPPAAAQDAAVGRFTLTHEVRWQNATLPAGDYTFALPSATTRSAMIVRGPNGTVFELGNVISNNESTAPSALLLEMRGDTLYISELDLNGVGVQIRYNVPKESQRDKLLARVNPTERVLIAMAK